MLVGLVRQIVDFVVSSIPQLCTVGYFVVQTQRILEPIANRFVYLYHRIQSVNVAAPSREIRGCVENSLGYVTTQPRPSFRLSNLFVYSYFAYFFRHVSFR